MKLVTYDVGTGPRAGVLADGHVIDATTLLGTSQTIRDAQALLELPDQPLDRLREALPRVSAPRTPLANVRLRAPVLEADGEPGPRKTGEGGIPERLLLEGDHQVKPAPPDLSQQAQLMGDAAQRPDQHLSQAGIGLGPDRRASTGRWCVHPSWLGVGQRHAKHLQRERRQWLRRSRWEWRHR